MSSDLVAVHLPRELFAMTDSPPEMVSQRTSLAVLAIPPRAFLRDVLPAFERAGGAVVRLGKLRLAQRVALVRYLESLAHDRAPKPVAEQLDGEAELMRELGITEARR